MILNVERGIQSDAPRIDARRRTVKGRPKRQRPAQHQKADGKRQAARAARPVTAQAGARTGSGTNVRRVRTGNPFMSAAAPKQEQHQHTKRHADHPQIALHLSILQPRQPAAAEPQSPAAFVKPPLTTDSSKTDSARRARPQRKNHQLRAFKNQRSSQSHGRPTRPQPNHRRLIEFVDEIAVPETAEKGRPKRRQRVRPISAFHRPAAVKPATGPSPRDTRRWKAALPAARPLHRPGHIQLRALPLQEGLEPGPRRRPKKPRRIAKAARMTSGMVISAGLSCGAACSAE